jgi:septal ring factor EnvC (AmiA/AmiB activator)
MPRKQVRPAKNMRQRSWCTLQVKRNDMVQGESTLGRTKMRCFRQPGFTPSAATARRHNRAVIFASLLLITTAQASGDEAGRQPRDELAVVTRELSAVKADLQEVKARISELEGDVAQTRDAIDAFREEVARSEQAAAASLTAPALTFPLLRDQARMEDVDVTGSVAPAKPLSQSEQRQLGKVDELLQRGDVAGARLLLEHAFADRAVAALRLGETYDPERLAAWRVYGVRADPAKARELYRRAYAGGIREARERLAGLP